jgi:hypothetical protein
MKMLAIFVAMCVGLLCLACIDASAQALPPANASQSDSVIIAISPRDPTSVQLAIDQAIKLRIPRIVIPAGVYRIPSPPRGSRAHLTFVGATQLEIDATGVTFIFTDRRRGSIMFADCDGVTFRGATLRRETLPFSQGRIEAIDEKGRSIDIRIDKGFPADIDDPSLFDTFWANVFDREGKRWLSHYRAATPPVMHRLGPDLLRVEMAESIASVKAPVEVGTPLCWRGATRDDLLLTHDANMTIANVTVEGGIGMCFHEMGGEGGNIYRGCRVTYPPRPAGAEVDARCSSCADGFHSSDVRRGPVIENCTFEGVDDDAIAIHGDYACVVAQEPSRIVLWRSMWASDHGFGRAGDHLRFYDSRGCFQQEATISATRELTSYRPDPAYLPEHTYSAFRNLKTSHFVELTLKESIPVQPNWLACNVDEAGSNAIIRDCTIRHTFARGIMSKSSGALIEGNTIEDTARAGIEFMCEMAVFIESDYSRGVIVRRNTIRNVSRNRKIGLLRHPGALTIFGYLTSGYVPQPGGHRDFTIENNLFEDNDGVNLLITSLQNAAIRNNRFVRPMCHPDTLGAEKKVATDSLVWMTECSGVAFAGNAVTQPGPEMKHVVTETTTAQATGLETGFHMAVLGTSR